MEQHPEHSSSKSEDEKWSVVYESSDELERVKRTKIELIVFEAEQFDVYLKSLHADMDSNNIIMIEHIKASSTIDDYKKLRRGFGSGLSQAERDSVLKPFEAEIQDINQLLAIIFTKTQKVERKISKIIKMVKDLLVELNDCVQNTVIAATTQSVIDAKFPRHTSFVATAPTYPSVSELEKEWNSMNIHLRLDQVLKSFKELVRNKQ